MQESKLKNYALLHLIIFIWGFTAILGALITIDAVPLVWFRMGLAVLIIAIYLLLIFNFIHINQKQQQKMKITLRKRKLKKGKTKLYLDIYKGYEKKN